MKKLPENEEKFITQRSHMPKSGGKRKNEKKIMRQLLENQTKNHLKIKGNSCEKLRNFLKKSSEKSWGKKIKWRKPK